MIKQYKINDSDREIFSKIEEVRERIIAEDREVRFLDFGAGNPDACRSEAEMLAGVEVVASTSKICRIGLKGEWAEYIYSLVKAYEPETILELGTCCGFSSIYMSKACEDSDIHTLDGAESVSEIAGENIAECGCENISRHIGRFDKVLPDLLDELKEIDFTFIDGHHDRDATLKYFDQIKPFLSSGAVVLFDDISWSEGMREAWQVIISDSSISYFEDKSKLGIVILK